MVALVFIAGAANATDPQNCVGCHESAVTDWEKSDHANAMAPATAQTVLGDFSGGTTSHYSQSAKFSVKDDIYSITFTEGDKTRTYTVDYTFGHYPLQQYLIETSPGKLQVFPFAWDTRAEEEGGQRWYPMHAEEDILPADRLHWQQPLQNWNGMCADCHSDGLKRNYTMATNTFDTTWDNINVGCQSCHGKITPDHSESESQTSALGMSGALQQEMGNWLRKDGEPVASWNGDKRDNRFMDTCFACHSLRSPLTDGFTPNKPYLDQFSPNLLTQPLYHADGQIHDEVYVYGSFLQSKMFKAGVNCLDCHDSHTMKVKTDTNGLCQQCHASEIYQQPEHLNHAPDSAGGQCVNCHMPQNTYMGVDTRRDHSFKVPRPALAAQIGAPDACTSCHSEQSAEWAERKISDLYKKRNPLSQGEQRFIKLLHAHRLPEAEHFALINDTSLNAIYRASAIAMLPNSVQQLGDTDIASWVSSEEPLIRLATAQVGMLLSDADKNKRYQSLLRDEYRAVRVQAASHLLNANPDSLEGFKQALDELLTSHIVSSWRGEGAMNLSMVQAGQSQLAPAISSLLHAVSADPYFDAAYVNLADLYRMTNQTGKEADILAKGISTSPRSPMLRFSYALHLIRQGDKPEALSQLKEAVKLDPANLRYAYTYFVALDDAGKTKQALSMIKMKLAAFNYHPQLVQLGLGFAQKLGDRESYERLAGYLR